MPKGAQYLRANMDISSNARVLLQLMCNTCILKIVKMFYSQFDDIKVWWQVKDIIVKDIIVKDEGFDCEF